MKPRHYELTEVKRRLPEYLEAIGSHWSMRGVNRIVAQCPLHEDKEPSFEADLNLKGVWLWFCHPCGIGGTVIDLHRERTGLTGYPLIADTASTVGLGPGGDTHPPLARCARSERTAKARASLKLPSDLHEGRESELCALASLRAVSQGALEMATRLGTLLFGTVCGLPCWLLLDQRGLIAEARRMDGLPFPAVGMLRKRKAHCLKGSVKSWPVGIVPKGFNLDDFRALMALEGGPDYLAALHFAMEGKADVLPVAFLGAGSCRKIHPEAAPLFANRRVRIYPHVDDAGSDGALAWTKQLRALGARVDWFDLRDLRKADASPVKDLNDLTQLHPDDEPIEPWEILP